MRSYKTQKEILTQCVNQINFISLVKPVSKSLVKLKAVAAVLRTHAVFPPRTKLTVLI